jgi:elongation factor P hydroxylase
MGRYAEFNMEVVQGDDQPISLTFKTAAGVATNIYAWDFYFKAERSDVSDTIVIAPAATVKSDSGTGVTDTVTFNITDTLSNVEPGYYTFEIAHLRDSLIETDARGTLTITERITAVI